MVAAAASKPLQGRGLNKRGFSLTFKKIGGNKLQKKFQTYDVALRFAAAKRKKGYLAHVSGFSKPWKVDYIKK